MLNQDSLAQLKGLKSQMESEKEHADAIVKGTQARYGFAMLEDGREIFIPPDEMLKAFPDDKVRVCIRPTKDNKTVANIEFTKSTILVNWLDDVKSVLDRYSINDDGSLTIENIKLPSNGCITIIDSSENNDNFLVNYDNFLQPDSLFFIAPILWFP